MSTPPKCPYCEQPITAWAVMKAPLPSAIRCLHCRKKIRVRNAGAFLAAYLLIVVALGTALIMAERRNIISSVAVIVIAVVALVFLEFVISMLLLRRATFAKSDA
ncbi:MAG TPA: hypothetical protein VGI88_12555 [Verrucomicrobiae bacterium]